MEDRRIRRTRKSIYSALATLLTEKDVHQIKVKELCERADINKSTFYLHFLDIYDCKEKWLEEIFTEMLDTAGDMNLDRMIADPENSIRSIVEFFDRDVEFYRKLLLSPFAAEFCFNLKVKLAEAITKAQPDGKPIEQQRASMVTFIICGAIDACILDLTYYKSEDVSASLKMIHQGVTNIINGLRKE